MHPVKPTRNQDKSLPPVEGYDIAGGAMTYNKVDNILSYHRPNHHIDKTSPDVEVYVQKIKRRRTGGNLGNFSLKMVWSQKRFANPYNDLMPCNPEIAKNVIEREQNNFYSNNGFKAVEFEGF